MKPKIRFKGFEGEWKETKYSSFATIRRGLTYSPENIVSKGIRVLRSSNIDEDVFLRSEEDVFVHSSCINIPFAKDGDILITAANGSPRLVGKHAVINKLNGDKVVPGGFMILASSKEPYFLNSCMGAPWYKTFLKTGVAGGNGAIGNLNKHALEEYEFYTPSNKLERDGLASYFTSLDSQISAVTSRLASLKQMKAASLQAMFPQEGETVPKIRFKGFEGEWKTCVLSSIATMHARIGWQNLRKDEFLSSGDYYLITGTDFHDGKISFETCHYIDKERYDQDKNIQLEIDSILITKDGTLGKVAFVDSLDKPATLNAGIFNVRTKDKEIYPKYLFQYLKAPYLMDYVNKNATGGTIKHLNQNMLVNFPVQYPSYKEQVMIGDYLFNLDRQISLQSQRLEKLKQIKSACLDKMFV